MGNLNKKNGSRKTEAAKLGRGRRKWCREKSESTVWLVWNQLPPPSLLGFSSNPLSSNPPQHALSLHSSFPPAASHVAGLLLSLLWIHPHKAPWTPLSQDCAQRHLGKETYLRVRSVSLWELAKQHEVLYLSLKMYLIVAQLPTHGCMSKSTTVQETDGDHCCFSLREANRTCLLVSVYCVSLLRNSWLALTMNQNLNQPKTWDQWRCGDKKCEE